MLLFYPQRGSTRKHLWRFDRLRQPNPPSPHPWSTIIRQQETTEYLSETGTARSRSRSAPGDTPLPLAGGYVSSPTPRGSNGPLLVSLMAGTALSTSGRFSSGAFYRGKVYCLLDRTTTARRSCSQRISKQRTDEVFAADDLFSILYNIGSIGEANAKPEIDKSEVNYAENLDRSQ